MAADYARGTHCLVVGSKLGGRWRYAASQPLPQWRANALVKAWSQSGPPEHQVAFTRPAGHPDVTGADVSVQIEEGPS